MRTNLYVHTSSYSHVERERESLHGFISIRSGCLGRDQPQPLAVHITQPTTTQVLHLILDPPFIRFREFLLGLVLACRSAPSHCDK